MQVGWALSFFVALVSATAWAKTGVTPINPALKPFRYECIRALSLSPEQNLPTYEHTHGFHVTERDNNGNATRAVLRLLVDNSESQVGIQGEFNDWGTPVMLTHVDDSPYFEVEIPIFHGMEYRLVLNGRSVTDPAASIFTSPELLRAAGKAEHSFLNSMFWDFDRPGAYRPRVSPADLRGQPVVIGETEVHALVAKWWHSGRQGPERLDQTYRFVAESGVIGHLKDQGYNAIEFLPFNASVDGQSWHLRYQVFGLFAPEGRYGTPDDFARMIDAFNEAGIAVIMDAVVGHYPFQGNNGVRAIDDIGQHVWLKANGERLFGQRMSPWNTFRYDYTNPYMRAFLIDSVLSMFKRYGMSGIRFDNLDGIRFEPGGWLFLKELVTAIRRYRPDALLIGEMFFGENKVLRSNKEDGLGIDTRTHSTLFDFVKDNMLRQTEHIDMEALGTAIASPWHWGEAPRVSYITNHDEAANRRDGATGQYPASLVDGGGDFYTQRKVMAFASVVMFSGSFFLDLPQMRLLQKGTFYTNPAVDWNLRNNQEGGPAYYYFKQASWVFRNNPAFAFHNFHERVVSHVDHHNKVIVLERYNAQNGKKTYALINLGHYSLDHYRFGVSAAGRYNIALDSDRREFGGSHTLANIMQTGIIETDRQGEHGKRQSIVLPHLAPYGTVILEQQ